MEHKVFGCKVNKFYLNKWMRYFEQYPSFVNDDKKAIIATCVVTDRAKSKRVKDCIQRCKNGQTVFLTGCGAFDKGDQMDYQQFFSLYPELAPYKQQIFLLGEDPEQYGEHLHIGDYDLNKEIGFEAIFPSLSETRHQQLRDKLTQSSQVLDISSLTSRTVKTEQKNTETTKKMPLTTRKFIVIQSGCDTFCTFCLTIYKRGSNRNRPLQDIIDEINEYVDMGGQEIIITGVNLAARGASHTRKVEENRFASLLAAIRDKTSIPRIRISSLGPEFLTDEFFDVMHDTRFLPHFHFSLQHFSTSVLSLMNRNYDATILDDVLTKIRQLDRPDRDHISIGGDIIVGFPGETEADFQQTFDAVQQYGITKLHAFPFSPHQKGETVPAGKLPNQVPQPLKKERERRLLAEGERVRKLFVKKNIGLPVSVLLETYKDGARSGWSENYIKVTIPDPDKAYRKGQIVSYTLS